MRLKITRCVIALIFTVSQVCFPSSAVHAATSAPAPFTTPAQVTGGTLSVKSQSNVGAPATPPSALTGQPLPAQGVITPQMVSQISNVVATFQGTNVVDVSRQGGTLTFNGSVTNSGTLYLVSSSPQVTTATIIAHGIIYNQSGGLITTVLPAGGLPGITNPVSSLNLVLNAVQNILNAGTIASSGHLTAIAGGSIVNALPAGVTGPPPVMQAAANLNLISPNIVNAGVLQSIGNNINIASQTVQNILINNVGGTIQALQGAINVRDAIFSGKYNFSLLGGDVIAQQLNLYSGNGLVDLQVNHLTPVLNIYSGDGFVSAQSDTRIANAVFSGDPIIQSGGNVVFASDVDANGRPTGIVTGGGIFSGADALIAPDVNRIIISGAILNLTGSAQLARLPISVASSLVINAGGNINTSNINAGSAIILTTSGGSITTGSLSAGNFVQAQAGGGSVTMGSVTAHDGVIVQSAQSLSVPSINVFGGGPVDLAVNQATPFVVGGGNVGSITLTGTSPPGFTGFVHILNNGTGGITVSSANAVSISTPSAQLALDAGSGAINLPAGTIAIDSSSPFVPAGAIVLSAGQINADGTTLSASNKAGGPAGFVFLGANTINYGSGLTIHADGSDGGVGIGGTGSVIETSTFSTPVDVLSSNFNGNQTSIPVTMQGQALTVTANGRGEQIFVDGSRIAFSGGTVAISANGTGTGSAGFIQVFGTQIVNAGSMQLSANGAASDLGGFIQVRATDPSADLTVKPGVLSASAMGGPTGGDGGQIDITVGHTLSVDPTAVNASVQGGNGNGGRTTLVGGTPGLAGGGLVFTNGGTINENGQGSGNGGLVELGAFGTDSNLSFSAQSGTQSSPVNISAMGGASGFGGFVQSFAGNNMSLSGASINASAGGGNSKGGLIDLTARLTAQGGAGNFLGSGTLSANGAGTGSGGFVRARGPVVTFPNGGNLTADGGTGGGLAGSVVVQAGGNLSLSSVAITASSTGGGQGGIVELDAGFASQGNFSVTGTVVANGSCSCPGGFVTVHSFSGDMKFGNGTTATTLSADGGGGGGTVLAQAIGNLTIAGAALSASSTGTNGNGGGIELDAGLAGSGTLAPMPFR